MKNKKTVSAAPYFRSKETTATIMWDVVIALTPAALFGIYRLGFRAFLILLLSVTSCVLAEHVWKRARKLPNGGYECSAVVTGLLLGMLLPADVPYWLPVVGGAFAIIMVKMLFGGLGRNFLNPAATTRSLIFILSWIIMKNATAGSVDISKGNSLSDLFFGGADGMIGGLSPFLLLLGGLYLVICKVISIRIPAMYLISFAIVVLLSGGDGFDLEGLAMQMCSGSLVLGAFFMATDYSTSPMTSAGKLIFGLILGGMTGVLRMFVCTDSAVVFTIVLGNLLVPLLEKMTLPKSFGKREKSNK